MWAIKSLGITWTTKNLYQSTPDSRMICAMLLTGHGEVTYTLPYTPTLPSLEDSIVYTGMQCYMEQSIRIRNCSRIDNEALHAKVASTY